MWVLIARQKVIFYSRSARNLNSNYRFAIVKRSARGGTRTLMPFGMRPLNARVCHFTTRASNLFVVAVRSKHPRSLRRDDVVINN